MSKQAIKNNSKFSPKNVLISAVLIGIVGAVLLIFTQAATPEKLKIGSSNAVSNASYSLSPGSGTFANGSNINIVIKENSGSQQVFSLGLQMSYDTNKFNFVSINNTGSPFTNCQDLSGASGLVKVTCYISPSATPNKVSGEQIVANVTLQAKVGSGSSALTFGSKSEVNGIFESTAAENIWNGTTSAASYSFSGTSTPNPTPTPTPTPNPTPTPTPNPSGGTKTPTTPPKSPSTPSPSPTPTPTTPGTPPPVTPTTPTEDPGTTTSYVVSILVKDSKGKPVSNATVEIGAIKAKTDAAGVASFENLKAGKYTVTVTSGSGSAKKEITVLGAQADSAVQQFDIKVNNNLMMMVYVGVGIVALVGLGFGGTIAKKKMDERSFHKARFEGTSNDALFTHVDTTLEAPSSLGSTDSAVADTNVIKPESKPEPAPIEKGTDVKADVIKPTTDPASTEAKTPDTKA